MKPVQYQKGWTEFYKLRFKVTPDVLIPRPETELLVDAVLKFVKNNTLPPNTCPLTILDLGTGSGNIAISIAKNLPNNRGITIIATDVSQKALKIARQNAKLNGVLEKIKFTQSNLLSALNCTLLPARHASLAKRVTCNLLIVTNLPYIPSARIPYLDSSVKDFEPYVALDGGQNGFKLYDELFQQINKLGWKPKLIIGEIDYTHGEMAVNIAQKYFPEAEIEVKKDLAHLQRILTIKSE